VRVGRKLANFRHLLPANLSLLENQSVWGVTDGALMNGHLFMTLTALIVDDEPHICQVAGVALRAVGCHVVFAADGEQAWRAIQADCPDIVVTDIQMPKIDGIQLVRLIRSTPKFAALPIILLTAKGLELRQFDSELVGDCDIVSKPFSPAALARRVHAILSARAAEVVAT
jgi:DNA-binding response OmpR family regulator